jgi:hypothetical protein
MALALASKMGLGDPVKLRVGPFDQQIPGRPIARSESVQKSRNLAGLRHLPRRKAGV